MRAQILAGDMQDVWVMKPKVEFNWYELNMEETRPVFGGYQPNDLAEVRRLNEKPAGTEILHWNFPQRTRRDCMERRAFLYSYQFTSRPESHKEKLLRSLQELHGSVKAVLAELQKEVSVRRLKMGFVRLKLMASSLVHAKYRFSSKVGQRQDFT